MCLPACLTAVTDHTLIQRDTHVSTSILLTSLTDLNTFPSSLTDNSVLIRIVSLSAPGLIHILYNIFIAITIYLLLPSIFIYILHYFSLKMASPPLPRSVEIADQTQGIRRKHVYTCTRFDAEDKSWFKC